MQAKDLLKIARTEWAHSDEWYKLAAVAAWRKGHYRLISSPTDGELYLARFWLNTPIRQKDKEWSGANSVLIHHFIRPDDDRALHDHPNDFKSLILKGGYEEQLPSRTWKPGSKLGPKMGRSVRRVAGDTIFHEAADLHLVGTLARDTWTMVTTGPRIRLWGFHPTGEQWIESHEYLNNAALQKTLITK